VFGGQSDLNSSGVAWGAVIGGAFVAAALSLILLALGAGFGLSAVSPWSNVGTSAETVGAAAIIWLILTEAISSAMGGYLAGRLRTKWVSIHNDEVHFRDTANGFLVWAVAVVMTVVFMATAAATMVGGAATAEEASLRPGGTSQGVAMAGNGYFVDRLFRSDRGPAPIINGAGASAAAPGQEGAANGEPAIDNDPILRSEASRIFAFALLGNAASPNDTAYLTQLVASQTGLSAADAQKRVSDTIADARQAEDDARKATAHLLLWVFLALLIGAFCASYTATIGGRQRDHVRAI
jgi:hypothetical protein